MKKNRPAGPPSVEIRKPTKAQLPTACGKRLPDLIAPRLKVLFVGINPGLYSAGVGHHFARPGNRFWPVLHQAGFTERQFSPFEERELLKHGLFFQPFDDF
jgi:TDG/mug DNA glycosylase family protein